MKNSGRRSRIGLSVKLALTTWILGAAPLSVLSQSTVSKDIQEAPTEVSGKRTSADETFELKIDERRFTRANFEASTAVSTNSDAALNLQIGVGLVAGKIDVVLRNVEGHVRFRGTLERILEMMNNRRPIAPTPTR